MPDSQLTPEEKLLRIIETPSGAVRRHNIHKRPKDYAFTLKLLASRYKEKLKVLLTPKAANALLISLSMLGTFFLLLDFWMGTPRLHKVELLEAEGKSYVMGNLTIAKLSPLSQYMNTIASRNIFALPEPKEVSAESEAVQIRQELVNLADTLKVVGIIWSQAPQAIIEDIQTAKTYLVNRGSTIKAARVKEILKDRVILSYHEEEIELY